MSSLSAGGRRSNGRCSRLQPHKKMGRAARHGPGALDMSDSHNLTVLPQAVKPHQAGRSGTALGFRRLIAGQRKLIEVRRGLGLPVAEAIENLARLRERAAKGAA